MLLCFRAVELRPCFINAEVLWPNTSEQKPASPSGLLWSSHLTGRYADLPRSPHWRSFLASREIWKAGSRTLLEHAWIPWSPGVVLSENKSWGQLDLGPEPSFPPA